MLPYKVTECVDRLAAAVALNEGIRDIGFFFFSRETSPFSRVDKIKCGNVVVDGRNGRTYEKREESDYRSLISYVNAYRVTWIEDVSPSSRCNFCINVRRTGIEERNQIHLVRLKRFINSLAAQIRRWQFKMAAIHSVSDRVNLKPTADIQASRCNFPKRKEEAIYIKE